MVQVRTKLINTKRRMEAILAHQPPSDDEEWYQSVDEIAAPLLACYWSLWVREKISH